jgi:hypothetical protein
MLWGYLDESGEHVGNRLIRLTVAGCMASFETWQQFGEKWNAILSAHNIPALHMKQLASRKAGRGNPYQGWTQKKKIIPNLRSISTMEPSSCIPLQAADLFAYEFSHCKDWSDLASLRRPLKMLRASDASFLVNQNFNQSSMSGL